MVIETTVYYGGRNELVPGKEHGPTGVRQQIQTGTTLYLVVSSWNNKSWNPQVQLRLIIMMSRRRLPQCTDINLTDPKNNIRFESQRNEIQTVYSTLRNTVDQSEGTPSGRPVQVQEVLIPTNCHRYHSEQRRGHVKIPLHEMKMEDLARHP